MNRKILLLLVPLLISFAMPVVSQEVAPDFTLSDIDGNQFSLSSYAGKVVLLDFFATWCRDCIAEIPDRKSLQAEFGGEMIIISISVSPYEDTVEKLRQFRQDNDINWTVAIDNSGVGDDYDVGMIPKLVIIDREGYICHQHVGSSEYTVLHEEIHAIISESGPNNDANNTGDTSSSTHEIILIIALVSAILTSFTIIYGVLSRKSTGNAR